MRYFKNCKTEEDAENVFKEWVKKVHPDVGGSEDDFIELKNQYDEFLQDMNPIDLPEIEQKSIKKFAVDIKLNVSKKNADALKKGLSVTGGAVGSILMETAFEKLSKKFFNQITN
jgi:hypothetical protein